MVEKAKAKAKSRGKKRTGKAMSSFVVLTIVLSVLAASIAPVIAQPPQPPEPTSITVAADPSSIHADGAATSILTATALRDGTIANNVTLTFEIISGPVDAVLVGADELGQVYPQTDAEGKASATLQAGTTPGNVNVRAYYTGAVVEISGNTTVTLTEPGARYNLTISSTAGGTVTLPGEGTFTYDSSDVVPLMAVPDAGYRFVNWTGDVGTIVNVNANETTITMNGNYTIVANFTKMRYNLTISSTAGGTVTLPGEETFTYDAGTVVPLMAVPDAGYRFVNWTGDVGTIVNVNANETTITMNGNYTIMANFAEIVYGVNLTVTPDVQTVASDVTATYTLTVENTGNTEDTFDIAIDDVPAGAIATLSEGVTPGLAPNGTHVVSLNVSSATADEYIVNVTATSQGDPSKSDRVTTKTIVTKRNFSVSIEPSEVTATVSTLVMVNVTDEATTEAVEGATVNLSGCGVEMSNATNAAGIATVEVNASEAGNIIVTVSKSGYNDWEGVITVIPPANIIYSDLNVTPTSGTAPLEITASATVENVGGVAGDYNATLKIDDVVVDSTTGTLAAGANTTVSFAYTLTTAGTYSVTIDELTAIEVTVSALANFSVSISPSTVTVNVSTSVEVNVTDADTGTAVEGATVNLGGCGVDLSIITNTAGIATFEVNASSTGNIVVTVSKAGYDTWTKEDGIAVQEAYLKGDVNDDGFVNTGDLTYLARYLAEWPGYTTTPEAADVNDDGFVNTGDLTYLARYLAEWPGYTL
jgi:hypothetical protein